ncbi:MAG: oxygen-independent coproporphyrinogen III oxidase [Alphaproteobacteria bacterium]|nr:oxygen-independent coproporphyrinogen III oxidase [Alphaproteobacteria bacterium]
MTPELISRFDQRVPRYTSYPTAPHFQPGVGADRYAQWLRALPPEQPVSLYVHVPFCHSLCWFCGCHTKIVKRYDPIARYVDLLLAEIDLAAEAIGSSRRLGHLHFGGGTPTILSGDDVCRLGEHLHRRFEVDDGAEIAVEIDPRSVSKDKTATLAAIGVTRASIGLQDVNPKVQEAVNRVQTLSTTRRVIDWLREAGIEAVNIDLMYGLPHQDQDGIERTVEATVKLAPDRLALFGYAHVPWMKTHQRLIDEAALPDTEKRWAQFDHAGALLCAAGYRPIGLDHFAKPDDPLVLAQREGRLRRNFQGYTVDSADALIGLGPSAIGALPEGYLQNHAPLHAWRDAVGEGHLPIARGLVLSDEDRLRRSVIERLMCDLEVDLAKELLAFDRPEDHFATELERLDLLAADGLVAHDGQTVRVPEAARPLIRIVAAVFDQYLAASEARHAVAV